MPEQAESQQGVNGRSTNAAERGWQYVALALATATAVALVVIPTFRSVSVTISGERTVGSLTLLQVEGVRVLVPLAVPVVLTLGPLLVSRRRRGAVSVACTLLLTLGVLLAWASIGMFFVPALVAAIAASVRSARARPERTP